MSERLTAATEQQVGNEGNPDRADDHRHRVRLHGAADAERLGGRRIGEEFAFTPSIGHKLTSDVARDMRIAPRPVAEILGSILREIGIVACAITNEVGAFMTAVVGNLLHGAIGDRAGLACKALQVILREVAGVVGAAAKIAAEPAGVVVVEAVEPGHRIAPQGFARQRPPRGRGSRPCTRRPATHIGFMSYEVTMSTADARLDRQFERIGRQVPATAGFLRWVRRPHMHLVRIPLALLLILGGVFSFLPILGLWMLPLGLLVLAIDVPPLKRPVGNAIVRLQRWIATTRRRFRKR